MIGKRHNPRILKPQRVSYSDLHYILRLSRGDLSFRPIFIVASVELGNSTTKAILTATDIKSGRTYVLNKAVRMTREALSPDDAFCHTLSNVKLSERSIAEHVRRTLEECTHEAGISIADLHFVVRSTGVTACFSKVEEVAGVIQALAKGCMLAGVPPRKMVSPMTVDNIPEELRPFSKMDRTYFDGAVAGNLPPSGEPIVGNEMEGELVTAGMKEAAKWVDVDFRNPVLSLDFGTTLAGRITDDELPYGRVIGSFCGLAGAIPDALVSGVVSEEYPTMLDFQEGRRRRLLKRVNKKVVRDHVDEIMEHIFIGKVSNRDRVGGVPVNPGAAQKNNVVLIGVDAGYNCSDLPKIAEIGEEIARNDGEHYISAVVDELSAFIVERLVEVAIEEGLLLKNMKIGITGRAGITGDKPFIVLDRLSTLFGRKMDEEVVFADDGLARGAAVLGRCMHQFGTPENPIGGVQGGGCVMGMRLKLQRKQNKQRAG